MIMVPFPVLAENPSLEELKAKSLDRRCFDDPRKHNKSTLVQVNSSLRHVWSRNSVFLLVRLYAAGTPQQKNTCGSDR